MTYLIFELLTFYVRFRLLLWVGDFLQAGFLVINGFEFFAEALDFVFLFGDTINVKVILELAFLLLD